MINTRQSLSPPGSCNNTALGAERPQGFIMEVVWQRIEP